MSPRDLRSFAGRVLLATALVALIVTVLLLLRATVELLLVGFAGVLLAIFLRGLGDQIAQHTPLGPRQATALVTLVLFGGVGIGIWLLVPRVVNQVDDLTGGILHAFQVIEGKLQQYPWGRRWIERTPDPSSLIFQREHLTGQAMSLFSNTLGALIYAAVILFVGLYIAFNPGVYRRGLLYLVPDRWCSKAREILHTLGHALAFWLIARVSAMLVVGVLTTIGLWIIGFPLAITLGLIAGLLSFIPFVGPALSFMPALLIGIATGVEEAVQVTLVYIVVQLLESYLITPLIERKAVSLPPALLILFQFFLASLAGAIGILLATPVLVVIVVLVQVLYVRGALGKQVSAIAEDR